MTCFFSCKYFTKQKIDTTRLDSISFTSVDKYPSFKVCDSVFEKNEKRDCFRMTIHREITRSLATYEIKVKKEIDEVIQVVITINSDKNIVLTSIEASQDIYREIPDIEIIIKKAIADLPEVFPAIKKSIPVTSEYMLPIRIKLKNQTPK
ncbi:MAG: hypothetical protein GKR88_09210 [Flavobacteriaceae bacterium]|nr:MAG: hypothetical protein GKR88_09210 [Flavobacteriaceae bacterium]